MAVAAKVKEPSIDHMETRWIDVFGTGFGAGEDNHVHKGKTTVGYGNYPTKGNQVSVILAHELETWMLEQNMRNR